MRPLVIHASSKAETDHRRRVLHIEYADSLDMGWSWPSREPHQTGGRACPWDFKFS
jgi:hypothetical protein